MESTSNESLDESLEPPAPPKLLREISGIDINPEIDHKYYLIRSIAVNNDSEDGDMKINDLEKELFEGLNELNSGFVIEYFGLPSTMLCDGGSVVMASQIYERNYTKQSDKYSSINTYKEYYNKRHKINETSKEKSIITWLGKPSIIFSYRDRNILKQHLRNDPVINFFFWITSFNSSKCIGDYFTKNKERLYCDNYQKVKDFCKNTKDYQIHDTFLAYHNRKYRDDTFLMVHKKKKYQPTLHSTENDDVKFLTDFNKAVERILIEDKAIDQYNEDNQKMLFQRYNEVFTYFFPWDIDGIEIGNIETEQMNELLNNLKTWRDRADDVIIEMIADTDLIDKLNKIILFILENNPKYTKKLIVDEFDSKYTYFLVAKFLLLAECDFLQHQPHYILKCSDKDRIRNLLIEISNILKKPIILYEYALISTDSNKFNMNRVGSYDGTTQYTGSRTSNFTLLEQIQDDSAADQYVHPEKKLTKVKLSNKQLVSTSRGGRKLRRTINRWRKTRITRQKTKKQKKYRYKTRKRFHN
jgi:hypothetical protein